METLPHSTIHEAEKGKGKFHLAESQPRREGLVFAPSTALCRQQKIKTGKEGSRKNGKRTLRREPQALVNACPL
jgi:hypothetical protein